MNAVELIDIAENFFTLSEYEKESGWCGIWKEEEEIFKSLSEFIILPQIRMHQENAKKFVERCDYFGGGWRLPTEHEMKSIKCICHCIKKVDLLDKYGVYFYWTSDIDNGSFYKGNKGKCHTENMTWNSFLQMQVFIETNRDDVGIMIVR